jgi:RNA polymerase sigma factor (sigma-70 family)
MTRTLFQDHIFPLRHKLFRFALRITGNTHEAEDVVQEVLEKVWKTESSQSEIVKNWEAWCMTLTRNRSLDKNRSANSRRTDSIEGQNEWQGSTDNLHQNTENQDLAAQIRRFMQDLPEKQRMVMHLRDIEEHSYEEIMEVMQIPMEQVKVNLHRARKAIREKMMTYEKHPDFA